MDINFVGMLIVACKQHMLLIKMLKRLVLNTEIQFLRKLFSQKKTGYGQTDRVLESSYGNMSAHKKFQLKIRS